MALDEQHLALPQLYGAPAYARPAPVVLPSVRPFDPDDLPIEAIQTPEERELVADLPARSYLAAGSHRERAPKASADSNVALHPRPLSLKALAGRILGQNDN